MYPGKQFFGVSGHPDKRPPRLPQHSRADGCIRAAWKQETTVKVELVPNPFYTDRSIYPGIRTQYCIKVSGQEQVPRHPGRNVYAGIWAKLYILASGQKNLSGHLGRSTYPGTWATWCIRASGQKHLSRHPGRNFYPGSRDTYCT